ncbi:MAG: cellulase family glycosylhydrolase [Spirochaetaceae bacterium]|nr:cellulase family glycosylhydrolase [Spirochaetaceae bacterium]
MLKWFETGYEGLPDLNKYDEADFACLKSMGVDVIRLPIHFEWIMEPKNTGKVTDIVFEKLDQVCDWAEKYQIYLVIDNHSFNEQEIQNTIPPETYKTHLKALWPQIAQRYKNRSEYIIYEILNEPPENLSKSWDKIQKETIELIRQYDTKHTIVVTCANWSNPDNLVKMKPYKDDNLIYTFHFYEPQLFVMQGEEGWASKIKDLPFPYDKSRMPKLSDDLEDWLKRDLQTNYPQYGNEKNINNKVKKIAAWAKKNKVRVWAGEIGASARTMPADRLVCIKANVAALKDENIPYCTWGIDYSFGFLETQDASMIFPDDIDKQALEAYGFTMPDESLAAKTNLEIKAFPKKPFIVYDGITTKGTSMNMYNAKTVNADDSHKYCAMVSYPVQQSNMAFSLPKLVTSKVIENHDSFYISFAVKFSNVNQVFRLNLSDTDEGEELPPWNITVPIRASDYQVGKWVTVEIPVSKFKESGAWSSKANKWFDAQGKFDWARFSSIYFDFDDFDGKKIGDIYIDDVVIKQK